MIGLARPDRRRAVTALAVAAAAGGLFGAGLVLSGMTEPRRVIGFLDITRGWDPTLAFVMASAIAVYAVLFRLAHRRGDPWFDVKFHTLTRTEIDVPLIVGAAVFGVGWGLGGMCPGPGLVAAASGGSTAILFVAAMLVGMLGQHVYARRARA